MYDDILHTAVRLRRGEEFSLYCVYLAQNNYKNWVFLLGRVFDKLVFSLLTVIYYWKVGRDFSPSNAPNIAGVLFLWCVRL